MANSYINFTKIERPRIKESEPGLSFTDIGRRLGEEWRELSEQQKENYADCNYDHNESEEESEEEYSEESE